MPNPVYRYVDKDGLSYFKQKIVALIPTNTNQLTNGAGFITSTVNNLSNYYLKTETYSKSQVDSLLGTNTLHFEVVQSLPAISSASTSVIYLVPHSGATTNNSYDEYVVVTDDAQGSHTGTANQKYYEKIGSTDIDLSGYVQKTQTINGKALSGNITIVASDISDVYSKTECDNKFVEKISGKGLSTNDYTTADKTKLQGIEAGAEVNDIVAVELCGTKLTPDSSLHVNIIIKKNGVACDGSNGYVDITVPTSVSQLTNDSGFVPSSDFVAVTNGEIDGMF